MKKKSFMFICILLIAGVFIFFSVRNDNNELENTEEIIETSSRSFGIMIETDDGNYEKYTDSNTWPTDYVYNEELSSCKDKDGNNSTVTMTYSNGKVTVTGNEATYCILYFRKTHTDSSLELLEILDQSNNVIGDCENTGNSYSCTVGSDVTAFKIKATVTDENATFTFTGSSTVRKGTATSSAYTLTAGSTLTKYVTVTAEDGSTTKYTVAVYKQDNDATLSSITASSGTWTTSCNASTTTCRLSVAYNIASVTLTPVTTSSKATVTSPITVSSLTMGYTKSTSILVTAEDGTTNTYTVNIYRASYSGGSSTSTSTSTSTSSKANNCTCLGYCGSTLCSSMSTNASSESDCTKNENLFFYCRVNNGVCTNTGTSTLSDTGYYVCSYSGS